jgi:signal peptidase I
VTDARDDASGAIVATRPGVPAVSERPAAEVRRRNRHRGLIEWVVVIIVALFIAAGLKAFVVEAFKIPSGSMEPTILIGDRVLVDKLSYKLGGHPHTGNIVVFSKPPAFYDPGVNDLIKRVIGTPGETLRSGAGGQIYVDGKLLPQPWLSASARANPGPPICSQNRIDCVGNVLHLPQGDYLVMGDNRDNSDDGRYFGPISGHLIVGRAFVRIWPLGRFHLF